MNSSSFPMNSIALNDLALEALITLSEYAQVLEKLSIRCSDLLDSPEFYPQFLKLIDGLQTFSDSVIQIQSVMNFKPSSTGQRLESDLILILNDLKGCQEAQDLQNSRAILKEHLPQNLLYWRTTGIPAMQSLREC
ncbi:MAG: hypothetical protein ACO3A2_09425 [Bdellovibrionia bacterium]